MYKFSCWIVVNGENNPLYNKMGQLWFFMTKEKADDFIKNRKIDKLMNKVRKIYLAEIRYFPIKNRDS